LASIDIAGDPFDDLGAAAGRVASRSIGVGRVEPRKDAGSMQEIMYQSVDSDHHDRGFAPQRTLLARRQQQVSER
jgi:hypothetical protein